MRGMATTTDTTARRVNTRIPADAYAMLERAATKRGLILTEGKGKGDAAIGRAIEALVREEEERTAKEPTLLALAKTEPDRAARIVLAAFEVSGGDGRLARSIMGPAIGRSGEVSDSDWKAARDRLSMGEEIKKRWPKGRA